jgi:hypothetical protein
MAKPIAALYLWCYPDGSKNYAGWHLTADARGCGALVSYLDELASGHRNEESRTLNVIPPTRKVLSVPGCRYAARSAQRLRLLVDRTDVRHFELREQDGEVSLRVGAERLPELRAHVEEIPRGGGDVSMVPDGRRPRDQALWFWWMLK